jgi:SAM-dependent methyltransferase
MGDWIAFWDSEHSLYVSARHRDVHYRTIAQDLLAYLPSAAATVLDYGCGEALHADMVAASAARLILVEAAPNARNKLAARFGTNPRIEVRSPEELDALPARSIDLVVLNSVSQYLAPAELDALYRGFHRLLHADGVLLVGDVVPPHTSLLTDTFALLRFALRNGFLLAALRGLARTALSDYRRLRSRLGLSRYSEGAMIGKLHQAGFLAARAETNIGHNQSRMTFVARPK